MSPPYFLILVFKKMDGDLQASLGLVHVAVNIKKNNKVNPRVGKAVPLFFSFSTTDNRVFCCNNLANESFQRL